MAMFENLSVGEGKRDIVGHLAEGTPDGGRFRRRSGRRGWCLGLR